METPTTQRIPTSKKTREWRINQVNAIASNIDENNPDWYRMWKNYKLKNNQIDQNEYREYCDTLGLKEGEGNKFVEPFNLTHNIIEVLKGEEARMPWSFGIINIAPNATNETIRAKEHDYRKYMDTTIAAEIEMRQLVNKVLEQVSSGEMSESEANKEVENRKAEIAERDKHILDPKQIENKFKSWKSKKEIAIHKIMKGLVLNDNLKWMKNEMFEDAVVAGVEAGEIIIDPYSGKPSLRQINALNLYVNKSMDTPFTQDADKVGYKEVLTVSDALDLYGARLEDADLNRLSTYTTGTYGTNTPFHSKSGWSESSWEERSKHTNLYPGANVPNYGNTTEVLSDGLYATNPGRSNNEPTVVVYTVYWRSQRRVGKLSYQDEYGNIKHTIVDETYPIPSRAVKVVDKGKMFGKKITKWEWPEEPILKSKQVGKPKTISIEWIWIPEVWKGIRINGDIFVEAAPYENAYQSLLSPYKVKIPVYGYVFGNRNAFSTCVMDRIAPWQKLYYIVISKWLKLITQDKGVVQLLNILMMDKGIGYKNSMAIAVDQGYLPYNPLAHAQGPNVGVAANHTPSSRLDLSNSAQLIHYTNILEFIEGQMKKAAGTPEARLAQTGANTNVTDNQRDVSQSMNITNSLFAGHELLWQEILQGLCETAVKSMDSQSGFIRQILSTDEIALINLDLISLEDEYNVKVGNNARAHQTLQEARGFVQSLIQNDKINFSTLLNLLDNDNLTEFKQELQGIEKEIEGREQKMQEQQQQHEEKQLKLAQTHVTDERKQKMAEIALKGEYDILGKQISGMAWDPEKDRDRDGMPDILEVQQFIQNRHTEVERTAIERSKVAQKDREIDQKNKELKNKDRQDNANRQKEITLKDKELKNKKELEKIKSKNKK